MKAIASDRFYVRESCPACGKHCFMSKKAAKRTARRIYPGSHMSFYECKSGNGFIHMSSKPERKKKRPSAQVRELERRKMERESFIEEALDLEYERAEKAGVAPVFTVEGKAWDEYDEPPVDEDERVRKENEER